MRARGGVEQCGARRGWARTRARARVVARDAGGHDGAGRCVRGDVRVRKAAELLRGERTGGRNLDAGPDVS